MRPTERSNRTFGRFYGLKGLTTLIDLYTEFRLERMMSLCLDVGVWLTRLVASQSCLRLPCGSQMKQRLIFPTCRAGYGREKKSKS